MRFNDRKSEIKTTVGNVCLILSLGAIFLQVWALITATEFLLQHKYDKLWPTLVLSGLALACCALTAWTTTLDLFKGKEN